MDCNIQQSENSPFYAKDDLKIIEDAYLIHKDPIVYKMALINRLNSEFAYIRGSPPIIFVIERQLKKLVQYTRNDLINVFSIYKYIDPECDLNAKKKTYISCVNLWLNSEYRSEYVEIGFSEIPKPGILNSYITGFLPKTEPGEVGPILEHLYDIWSKRNDVKFNYLIKWMALAVQKPFYKPGTAIGPISQQGGGKGVVTDKFARHYGNLFRTVRDTDVLSNFNSAVVGVFFLHLDESNFISSPEAKSALKRLITEDKIQVTYKGRDSITVESACSVIISSNNKKVCDAEAKARRFYPFYLDNKYSGPSTPTISFYMKRIIDVNSEHFIHYLQNNVDITDFNPREFELTEDLIDQMNLSLTSLQGFWLQMLDDPPDKEGKVNNTYNTDIEELKAIYKIRMVENISMPNEELYGYFKQYSKHLSTKYKKMNELSYQTFLNESHALIPSLTVHRKNVMKNGTRGKQGQLFIPSILEARKEWVRYVGFDPFEVN